MVGVKAALVTLITSIAFFAAQYVLNDISAQSRRRQNDEISVLRTLLYYSNARASRCSSSRKRVVAALAICLRAPEEIITPMCP